MVVGALPQTRLSCRTGCPAGRAFIFVLTQKRSKKVKAENLFRTGAHLFVPSRDSKSESLTSPLARTKS
jgi:hypothetical protein